MAEFRVIGYMTPAWVPESCALWALQVLNRAPGRAQVEQVGSFH